MWDMNNVYKRADYTTFRLTNNITYNLELVRLVDELPFLLFYFIDLKNNNYVQSDVVDILILKLQVQVQVVHIYVTRRIALKDQ